VLLAIKYNSYLGLYDEINTDTDRLLKNLVRCPMTSSDRNFRFAQSLLTTPEHDEVLFC